MSKNCILLILIGLLLAFTLFGCSTENQNMDESNQHQQENVQEEEQQSKPNQQEQTRPGREETANQEEEQDQHLAQLLDKMSLEDKLGQLIFAGISGTALTEKEQSLISNYKVGGVIFYSKNLINSSQTLTLLNQLKVENKANLLPLFLGLDQEGGPVSRLPEEVTKLPPNAKLGEIDDPQISLEIGASLGQQLSAFGFNLNFAPVLDVNSNPNNPVIGIRSFGSNPDLVSRLGRATMQGIQTQQVISVIKHFPGHGDTSVDSHLDLPVVDKTLEELYHIELIPFQEAIQAGAEVVMMAHILLPQLDPHSPATLSKPIITDLLRNKLSFEGVVITDDLTMKAITKHYEIGQASVEAIKAGSDILLVAHDYENVILTLEALQEAVQSGELSEARINESVRRIIQLKEKYALSQTPIESIGLEELNQSIAELNEKIK